MKALEVGLVAVAVVLAGCAEADLDAEVVEPHEEYEVCGLGDAPDEPEELEEPPFDRTDLEREAAVQWESDLLASTAPTSPGVAIVERTFQPLPEGLWLPYELGDLDASPLPSCSPRPSCVPDVLRLSGTERTVLTYDGAPLQDQQVEGPVVIADLKRGLALELPADSSVEVLPPHEVKSCDRTSCQIVDLSRGEVRVFEAQPSS